MWWLGWRNGSFAQRLCAGGVSLAWPSFECAGSPQSASMSGLILCLTTESEAGPESRKVAAARLACGWLAQPEEGVALHSALPQVFAALGTGQLEHKSVLLLTTLIVILHHNQCESTLFKVQASDFGPKEEADFVGAFKY